MITEVQVETERVIRGEPSAERITAVEFVRTVEPCDVTTPDQAAYDEDQAWQKFVQRYASLITTVIQQHRLTGAAAEDVSRYVWVYLAECLPHLKEPGLLPGWLIATTRRECQRYISVNCRVRSVNRDVTSDMRTTDRDIDAALLIAERRQVLLDALAELPDRERELLILLAGESPPSYADISEMFDMPIESVELSWKRALDMLRQTKTVQSYLQACPHEWDSGPN